MAMRVAVLVAAVLASAGCVMPKYRKGEWPEGVPAETYYAQVYGADPRNAEKQTAEEYFDWVLRFYKGYGVVLGWQAQESTLAKMLAADEYVVLSPQLAYLGQIVAGEWAKHNDLRRIDNEILILWGNVLRRAAKDKKAGEAVERIVQDAHAVLANELEKSAVKKDRYEDLLPAKQ
jgi:hypothetical protein